ncbi:hypothetical protein BS50DRAFT_235360 [Corynespora cassiicola Philippines]|uniref:Uncharacterized protein n=1 Tax=Corynespora cassiicola Philippines TaxID=1448308 RepID=A0A2T2P254_CORCC|nr:hypothetical protein BS50DRAFT_235360 [Corynespora cassiicola Philippines]
MVVLTSRELLVQLGVQPLADTVTAKIVRQRSRNASRLSSEAETKLKAGQILQEKRVPFPGDTDNFSVNFMGDAMFQQVMVTGHLRDGGHLWDVEDDAIENVSAGREPPGSRATSGAIPSQTGNGQSVSRSKALVLNVHLQDKAFFDLRSNPCQLMIDVFFNGQLSSCTLVNYRDRSGARTTQQVFAGFRVASMAERPWIILEPGKSGQANSNIGSVPQRWNQIRNALFQESEERGFNDNGEKRPSGLFIEALATMQMPDAVMDMQSHGRRFGVIDVVITIGQGSKVTQRVKYLTTPQRLLDKRYTSSGLHHVKRDNRPQDTDREPRSDSIELEVGSEQDAEGETDNELASPVLPSFPPHPSSELSPHPALFSLSEPTTSPTALRFGSLMLPSFGSASSAPSPGDTYAQSVGINSRRVDGGLSLNAGVAPTPTGPLRSLDHAQGIESSFNSNYPYNQSANMLNTPGNQISTGSSAGQALSAISSNISTSAQRIASRLVPAGQGRQNASRMTYDESPLDLRLPLDNRAPSIPRGPRPYDMPPPPPAGLLPPIGYFSVTSINNKKENANPLPARQSARSMKNLLADTTGNPPLNQDCVIRFAESKPGEEVLRQFKNEHPGLFEEDFVVCGMRFFVPG